MIVIAARVSFFPRLLRDKRFMFFLLQLTSPSLRRYILPFTYELIVLLWVYSRIVFLLETDCKVNITKGGAWWLRNHIVLLNFVCCFSTGADHFFSKKGKSFLLQSYQMNIVFVAGISYFRFNSAVSCGRKEQESRWFFFYKCHISFPIEKITLLENANVLITSDRSHVSSCCRHCSWNIPFLNGLVQRDKGNNDDNCVRSSFITSNWTYWYIYIYLAV